MKISEAASYVRSKNAGPFWVTVDIFFDNTENYQYAKSSAHLSKEIIGQVYQISADQVKLFFMDQLQVIKISYPRPCTQGGPYERDMHSGQQYIQILNLEL